MAWALQRVTIRAATNEDWPAIWTMLEPEIRAGEVYALPGDMSADEAKSYWFAEGNWVFVAELAAEIAGSYYLRANQRGGGNHVSNCGYVTAQWARGQGVAGSMCMHSLDFAKSMGFRAMQFNFVVSTNEAAVNLWKRHGFKVIGRLPGAFLHPQLEYVDAFVMWRELKGE